MLQARIKNKHIYVGGSIRHQPEGRAYNFDFGEFISDGDSHSVNWVMNLTHPKLNKGKSFGVPGATFFKVNEEQKIIMHRDYFDAGIMLYENIPLLGSLVKLIKSRL